MVKHTEIISLYISYMTIKNIYILWNGLYELIEKIYSSYFNDYLRIQCLLQPPLKDRQTNQFHQKVTLRRQD